MNPQDNLYQSPTTAAPQVTQPAQVQGGVTIPSFDLGVEFGLALYMLNIFVLVWTMFYSVIFFADFIFYRVRFSDGEVDREKKGVESIRSARKMWITYIVCLVVYSITLFTTGWINSLLSITTIVLFVLKMIASDLPTIPYLSSVVTAVKAWFGEVTKSLASLQPASPKPKK